MAEKVSYVCDLCGGPVDEALVKDANTGVALLGSLVSLHQTCPACEKKTTIADVRAKLQAEHDKVMAAARAEISAAGGTPT